MKGTVLYLRFLDHCSNGSADGVICEVWGRLVQETDRTYYLATWDIVSPDSQEELESNRETLTIIKSTVLVKRELQEKGVHYQGTT